MNNAVTIEHLVLPGLIVDSGRWGYQHQGITPAEPMDSTAFFWANALLDNNNKGSQATLELMSDLTCIAHRTLTVAVTGPNINVFINSKPVDSWSANTVHPGQSLSISSLKSGQRYYVAVEGGWQVPEVLGSHTTSMREGIGGLNGQGKLLKSGCALFAASSSINTQLRKVEIPNYSLEPPIRVVVSYQASQLGTLCQAQFFSQPFTLSAQSNRMGYRFEGEALPAGKHSLYSEALGMGAVQIPPNGQPIVMLADRQTLGGYPKIGTVAQADLPRLVQATPGESVRFTPIDVYSARNEWRLQYSRWQKIRKSFL